MLRALEIRDLLIIERLELSFQPGLNVLTGETGAGKSILLDSLGFVLGWRGRAELVRAGADQGEVTAEFELGDDHPAQAILAEAGLPTGNTLILRRTNSTDGRKTAYVNDRRCSGEVLRALSDVLVELHGQHDDRGLLNPRGHRQLLDQFANCAPLMDQVRRDWRAVAAAKKELLAAETALETVREEEEFLRHALGELDQLDPQPGEDQILDTKRRLMQSAERIRDDISKAYDSLGSNGAEGAMDDAARWLDDVATKAEGQLDAPLAALGRAMNELAEAQQGIEACLQNLSFDATELEFTEERLFAIRALARKHAVLPDDLGPFAQTVRDKILALDSGSKNIGILHDHLAAAQAAYDLSADKLSSVRHSAGAKLDRAMAAELAPLKMERAVFATGIEPGDAGPEGRDLVAFSVATNPGAPAGALNKIASGGELSRFLLALKVCLTAGNAGLTLIFDEIDRGVGGATANAVGRRLAELATSAQILVVTHSPQVAALGGHHWRVEKYVGHEVTTSTVVPLDQGQRVDEIARMLAGDRVTDAAREAARALLAP